MPSCWHRSEIQKRVPLACLQHLACCVCEDVKVIVFAVLVVSNLARWRTGRSREGDKWTMRLAAEVPAEAPVEAPAESPAQSPAPGGREDGMASSTTRKFKSLQAALAEPRLIGGWRFARKMMNCNAGSSVGARRNDGRDLRSERETTCTPEIECSSWRREIILTCTWDLPECAVPEHTPPKHI